jgi:hypothetical protein
MEITITDYEYPSEEEENFHEIIEIETQKTKNEIIQLVHNNMKTSKSSENLEIIEKKNLPEIPKYSSPKKPLPPIPLKKNNNNLIEKELTFPEEVLEELEIKKMENKKNNEEEIEKDEETYTFIENKKEEEEEIKEEEEEEELKNKTKIKEEKEKEEKKTKIKEEEEEEENETKTKIKEEKKELEKIKESEILKEYIIKNLETGEITNLSKITMNEQNKEELIKKVQDLTEKKTIQEGKKKSTFMEYIYRFRKDSNNNTVMNNKSMMERSIKVQLNKKTKNQFTKMIRLQTIGGHNGAIWCMKLNKFGNYLATGGQVLFYFFFIIFFNNKGWICKIY